MNPPSPPRSCAILHMDALTYLPGAATRSGAVVTHRTAVCWVFTSVWTGWQLTTGRIESCGDLWTSGCVHVCLMKGDEQYNRWKSKKEKGCRDVRSAAPQNRAARVGKGCGVFAGSTGKVPSPCGIRLRLSMVVSALSREVEQGWHTQAPRKGSSRYSA